MTDKDSEHGSIAPKESVLYKRIPMRDFILAERESNDMQKIDAEKRQFNALQDWSKKPRYQMPEESTSIVERAKRWLRETFTDRCECGGVYYDWSAKKSVCDTCRRVLSHNR